MSSNNKLMSGSVQNERLEMSPARDARQCFRRYARLLTEEEKAWFENFMQGYFRGDVESLKRLGIGAAKRRELVDEYNYNHNATRRSISSPGTRRGRYFENDYTSAETSPEDALIDWIDATREK